MRERSSLLIRAPGALDAPVMRYRVSAGLQIRGAPGRAVRNSVQSKAPLAPREARA
jgi:hypothetical protein